MIPKQDYIINELELAHLPDEEKGKIIASIRSHLENVLIETVIMNLSPEQLESMKKELLKENFNENEIMRITSGIPGIQNKIEEAMEAEWDLIKTSYQKIK